MEQKAKFKPSCGGMTADRERAGLSVPDSIVLKCVTRGNPGNKRMIPLPVVGQKYLGPVSVLILASNWWLVRTVM